MAREPVLQGEDEGRRDHRADAGGVAGGTHASVPRLMVPFGPETGDAGDLEPRLRQRATDRPGGGIGREASPRCGVTGDFGEKVRLPEFGVLSPGRTRRETMHPPAPPSAAASGGRRPSRGSGPRSGSASRSPAETCGERTGERGRVGKAESARTMSPVASGLASKLVKDEAARLPRARQHRSAATQLRPVPKPSSAMRKPGRNLPGRSLPPRKTCRASARTVVEGKSTGRRTGTTTGAPPRQSSAGGWSVALSFAYTHRQPL